MSNPLDFEPSIGIITALPIEYLAMKALVDEGSEVFIKGLGKCLIGKIRELLNGWHSIILAEAGMGNNRSALCAEKLRQEYPTIDTFIMVGIAGAVPNHEDPEHHVRLGDVVAVGMDGIVQYDFIKQSPESTDYRYPPHAPKARFLTAAQNLKREEIEGKYPWNHYIEDAIRVRGDDWKRPEEANDILVDTNGKLIEHPFDANRRHGEPRVFIGVIASGNTLLKDPVKRNVLRDELKAKAVEMEASGVADASWLNEIYYFAVRGACDYCDPNKNDIWQKYAAIVASAFTKAILVSLPSFSINDSVRPNKKKVETNRKNVTSQT